MKKNLRRLLTSVVVAIARCNNCAKQGSELIDQYMSRQINGDSLGSE
ncbi:MAG: hypothetical protein F6K45_12695 [Kamptonema sp. SIO1D9]|nr:hypothetical protein [Kamptonema sp. SIO1D9]